MIDARLKVAMAIMEARVAEDGVGTLRVDDGQIFMWAKSKLLELVASAIAAGSETVLVFVKNGSSIDDPVNNQ